MADATVLDTDAMLSAELDEVERRRAAAGEPPAPPANQQGETVDQRQARLGLSALCLSGGGIRSASFCLGVLQALAGKRLLNRFDYVSTVSGGGFIGGWLQMTLRETGDAERAQEALGSAGPAALAALRGYTSYLTPQSGPFSTDTWSGIVLYIRNLLLNWMVFAPLFLLLALAPIFYRTLIYSVSGDRPVALVLLAAAAGSLGVGAYRACALLPSHRAINPPGFASASTILWNVTAPVLFWAMVLPAVLDHGLATADRATPVATADLWPWLETAIPALYVTAMLVGYAAAWVTKRGPGMEEGALYRINALRWLAASACSAGLIWIGLRLIAPPHPDWPVLVNRETLLTVFAPLWLIGVHVLQTTFYVGFRKEALLADLDREWLARASAQALLLAVAWTGFALACLVLPPLLSFVSSNGDWAGGPMAGVAAGTTLVGSVAAWLGKRLSAGIEALANQPAKWTPLLLNGLSAAFAVGVFALAGGALQFGLGWVQQAGFGKGGPIWVPLLLQALLAALLYALTAAFGRVNVNRYSLHAVYRNRLVRAFLGSARPVRSPDPFTGFDPGDNPRLAAFRAAARQRLFPVINATLNVTAVSNAADAERKAESFTATPLACGSAALRHPEQRQQDDARGAFVPTTAYAGMDSLGDVRNAEKGVTIGTMLTISGAAVSPNWGYHSSRVTAFLMTLFNVRLGAWLPNPAVATAAELRLAKPADSLRALLDELLGKTTDDSQAVYLSDGGHFENLGLYEMLRRRCSRIVAVDAGQDGSYAFLDLGNALRKAAIDLGVTVTVRQPMRLYPRKAIEADKSAAKEALGFAVGDIRYGNGRTGELLYLKPSFLPDVPADVRAFGLSDPAFPHDSTADQWFTESQFESYRALGAWQMGRLADGLPDGATLEELFGAAGKVCPGPDRTVRLPETLSV